MKPIVLRGHTKPVNVVKFNYDGDLLFTAGADKRVNLFHGITGERIGNFDCRGAVKSIDITIDSKYLVTGGMEGTIEVWNVETGDIYGTLTKDNQRNKYLEFSYGDQYLLTVKKKN